MREFVFVGFCGALMLLSINSAEGAGSESARDVSERGLVDAVENEGTNAQRRGLEGPETIAFPADSAGILGADREEGRDPPRQEQDEVDVGVEQSGEDEASTAVSEEDENSAVEQEEVTETSSEVKPWARPVGEAINRFSRAVVCMSIFAFLEAIVWSAAFKDPEHDLMLFKENGPMFTLKKFGAVYLRDVNGTTMQYSLGIFSLLSLYVFVVLIRRGVEVVLCAGNALIKPFMKGAPPQAAAPQAPTKHSSRKLRRKR
ncbi:hypothetical protein Emed_007545 [Eimeria media]